MLNSLAGLLSIILYIAATGALLSGLRNRTRDPRTPALLLGSAAMLLHAVVTWSTISTPDGLALGLFPTLLLAACVIAALLLVVALLQPVLGLGIGIFPLAAITVAAGLVAPPGRILAPDDFGLATHILVSIAAYAVLSLAAMQALVLMIQHRLLHEHRPVPAMRALPPLSTMEHLLMWMIGIGFLLLTAALASGFIYLEDLFAQHLAHKTVLSIIAWCLFGSLLLGHWLAGWRGVIAVRFTLGGMILLALGYFGSKLVLEIILGRI